jgi:hypothetical protein
MITGQTAASKGEIYRDPTLRIAYFSQHHVNQLDLSLSPLEHMAKLFPQDKEETIRAQLGSFGVGGKLALQKMQTLSGGQKSRYGDHSFSFSIATSTTLCPTSLFLLPHFAFSLVFPSFTIV